MAMLLGRIHNYTQKHVPDRSKMGIIHSDFLGLGTVMTIVSGRMHNHMQKHIPNRSEMGTVHSMTCS